MTGTQGTRSAHFVSYRHHFRTILVSSLGSPHVPSPLPSAPEAGGDCKEPEERTMSGGMEENAKGR